MTLRRIATVIAARFGQLLWAVMFVGALLAQAVMVPVYALLYVARRVPKEARAIRHDLRNLTAFLRQTAQLLAEIPGTLLQPSPVPPEAARPEPAGPPFDGRQYVADIERSLSSDAWQPDWQDEEIMAAAADGKRTGDPFRIVLAVWLFCRGHREYGQEIARAWLDVPEADRRRRPYLCLVNALGDLLPVPAYMSSERSPRGSPVYVRRALAWLEAHEDRLRWDEATATYRLGEPGP